MGHAAYFEINLHVTWHTKHNTASVTDAFEAELHRYLRHRAAAAGAFVHAVGGTADHVHVAASVPPSLTISRWIGQLKGASAHYVNTEVLGRRVLEWQTGYGAVSFGTRDMPWVVRYVENQKEHHARGSVYERLERVFGELEGNGLKAGRSR